MRGIDSSMKVRTLALVIILALRSMRAVCAVLTNPGLTDGPVIRIDDVGRFYTVYDAAGSCPTAEQLQRDYLEDLGENTSDLFRREAVCDGSASRARTPQRSDGEARQLISERQVSACNCRSWPRLASGCWRTN
jgi:hypothetical protein